MKLIDALSKTANIDKDSLESSKIIYKIAHWAQIDPDKDISQVGYEGSYGAAFDIGYERILKITSDKHEASVSAAMIGLKHQNIAEIYKVAKLAAVSGIKRELRYKFDVFLILQKKYNQIDYEERQAINNLPVDVESDAIKKIGNHFYIKSIRKNEYIEADKLLENYYNDHYIADSIEIETYLDVANQVIEGLYFLSQHQIVYKDIHSGNVVKDDDENIVLIDFGGGSRTNIDRKNIDILERFIKRTFKLNK